MSRKLYNIIDKETRITRVWGLNQKDAQDEMQNRQREHNKVRKPGEDFPDTTTPMPVNPAKNHFHEEETGHFGMLGTAVLAAAARGHIDLNAWARAELVNRGLDRHGRWVGFEAAKEQLATASATPGQMRQALLAVKKLWDKHGLGDDDHESEPVYDQLLRALGTTAK